MNHKMIVCECGKVISNCRCVSKDKITVVSKTPCTHKKKAPKTTFDPQPIIVVHDTVQEKP